MSLILAIDTSAKPVSCALMQDDRLLASYYANSGLTHSQTLMPMIEHMLESASVTLEQVDALAVNAGPGSFTGVRIGVSAVKGLAFTQKKPCISVSTLEAMAQPLAVDVDTRICCVMDARCQQVYTALFEKKDGTLQRLTQDEAISLEQLRDRLLAADRPTVLVGDGSDISYAYLKESVPSLRLAPAAVRFQNAAGTAAVAMEKLAAGEAMSAEALLPVYLRLPQAERELRQRLAQEETDSH